MMKKLVLAACGSLFFAAAAQASPTLPHSGLYLELYGRVVNVDGLSAAGCKLIAPHATCHQKATEAKLVKSIGVLERTLAPPLPRAAAVTAPATTQVARALPTTQAHSYNPTTAQGASYSGTSSGGYTIPAGIVQCESGGNYSAVNSSSGAGGAYQILPSTWHAYGGQGLPQDASPAEQGRIAGAIYAKQGGSAWSC